MTNRSKAAAAMGSARSEAKAAAARANGVKGGRPPANPDAYRAADLRSARWYVCPEHDSACTPDVCEWMRANGVDGLERADASQVAAAIRALRAAGLVSGR